MRIYRATFIGHREIHTTRELDERLESDIEELIRHNEFVEFYIGRNGDFDILVASIIKRVQRRLGKEKSALILVLPYEVKDMEYYEKYYDDIIIPIEGVHFKSAIGARNRWMVDKCDVLFAYVERSEGGAADCLTYAEKQGLKIINYAER
ncbi:MAG: hypothetical protein IJV72_04740 [Clostridia bacterium]|nr:hypothetical protein [Clostridia bacterium]